MKQLIKYAAVLFALMLAAAIIGGCLTAGVAVVKMIADKTERNTEYADNGIWYRDDDGDVVFLGIHIGSNSEGKNGNIISGEVKSGSESFAASEIDSLYVDGIAGEIIVEVWDNEEISVVYEDIPEEYEIYIDNGELVIEREDGLVFWGFTFNQAPKIYVSVPKEKTFEVVKVNKGSGNAKIIGILTNELTVDNGSGGVGISDVTVEKLYIESGSGSINISDVIAEKSVFDTGSGSFGVQNSKLGTASLNAGSGFVNFENIVAENLVVDSGSGKVDVTGKLTGNCVFESGSGSINVEIYGKEEDYNIRTDMSSGSFYLNGEKEKDEYIEHDNAEHLLVFDIASGRVSVEFKNVPANFKAE